MSFLICGHSGLVRGGVCSWHHLYELQVLDPWRDLDMGGEEERDEKQEEGKKDGGVEGKAEEGEGRGGRSRGGGREGRSGWAASVSEVENSRELAPAVPRRT